MAGFYIWETADLAITLSEPVLVDYKEVIVSIAQTGTKPLHLTDDDVQVTDESTITISLSQEQTGQFHEGAAKIQVNVLFESSERDTTAKGTLDVLDNLYKQVMS